MPPWSKAYARLKGGEWSEQVGPHLGGLSRDVTTLPRVGG